MSYSVGIDIGTTFTACAVAHEGGRVELVNLGGRAASIPSVIVVRHDGEILVGESAEARASLDPTRVARDFKRRLGDPTPLILGSMPYSADTLTTMLLRHVYGEVVRRLGGPPVSVVITHPASYTEYRLEVLRNAAAEAGLPNVTVVSEPQAAAAHYATTNTVEAGGIIAIYDFGGGTFDIALLRESGGRFALLGAPVGVDRLGGVDFDLAVLQHVSDAVGGRLERLDPADPATLSLLAKLRSDSRHAKEMLSSDRDTTVTVIAPGLTEQVTLTRSQFESIIRPRLEETFSALRRAVEAAGITVEQIDRIVLVGGSSRIPLIREEVRIRTGRPIAEDVDPEYAVAFGAARLSAQAIHPAAAPRNDPTRPFVAAAPASESGRRSRRWVAASAVAAVAAVAVAAVVVTGGDDGGDRDSADPTTELSIDTTDAAAETIESSETTVGQSTRTTIAPAAVVSSTLAPDTVAPTTQEPTTAAPTVPTTSPTTLPPTTIPRIVSSETIDATPMTALLQDLALRTDFRDDTENNGSAILDECPIADVQRFLDQISDLVTIEVDHTIDYAQATRPGEIYSSEGFSCLLGSLDTPASFRLTVEFLPIDDTREGTLFSYVNDDGEFDRSEDFAGGFLAGSIDTFITETEAVWLDEDAGVAIALSFTEAGVSVDVAVDALKILLQDVAAAVLECVPAAASC